MLSRRIARQPNPGPGIILDTPGTRGEYWAVGFSSFEDIGSQKPAQDLVQTFGSLRSGLKRPIIFDNMDWVKGSAVSLLSAISGGFSFVGSGLVTSSDFENGVYPNATDAPLGAGLAGIRVDVEFEAIWISGGDLQVSPTGTGIRTSITSMENGGVKKKYKISGVCDLNILARVLVFSSENGAIWEITDVSASLYSGRYAFQMDSVNRPRLKQTRTTKISWLESVKTPSLITFFSSALGSDCTLVSVSPEGVLFTENLNVTTSFGVSPLSRFNTDLLLVNRRLTLLEKSAMNIYFSRRIPRLGQENILNGDLENGMPSGLIPTNRMEVVRVDNEPKKGQYALALRRVSPGSIPPGLRIPIPFGLRGSQLYINMKSYGVQAVGNASGYVVVFSPSFKTVAPYVGLSSGSWRSITSAVVFELTDTDIYHYVGILNSSEIGTEIFRLDDISVKEIL